MGWASLTVWRHVSNSPRSEVVRPQPAKVLKNAPTRWRWGGKRFMRGYKARIGSGAAAAVRRQINAISCFWGEGVWGFNVLASNKNT